MTRNTTRSIARRAGLAAVAGGVLLAAGGCVLTVTSGVQPEIEVTCPDRTVQAVVKNTDSVAHRYTVTVAVRHDEMTEDVLLSSESVAAGSTTTLRETVQTEEPIGCTLKGVQSFPG